MASFIRNIINRFRPSSEPGHREAYYQALLRNNLPEVLKFSEPELEKVTKLMSKDFSIQEFATEVHRNDVMFHYHLLQCKGDLVPALYSYFAVGARFAAALAEYLDEQHHSPARIMDFGSGYGRVSRFLPFHWPAAKISVSEVKEEAMDFQERFEFTTIRHTPDPQSFTGPQYDLIMALSVFSHLPQDSFTNWLKVLLRHLAPAGRCIFSFNPLQAKHYGAAFKFVANSEDLHFPYLENANLNLNDYGHAYLSRELIADQIDPSHFSLNFLGNRLSPGQETAEILRKA